MSPARSFSALPDRSRAERATIHWAFTDLLPPFGATFEEALIVKDGNLITAGGVTSGIDFGLSVIAEIADERAARTIQLGIEYDPAPLFDSGHPDRAPAAIRTALLGCYEKARSALRAGSDSQWMSRFDDWPRPETPIKQSSHMIEDDDELCATRTKRDAESSDGRINDDWLSGDLTWFSGAVNRQVTAPKRLLVTAFLQPPDPPSGTGARAIDRGRREDRRHRPVRAYRRSSNECVRRAHSG